MSITSQFLPDSVKESKHLSHSLKRCTVFSPFIFFDLSKHTVSAPYPFNSWRDFEICIYVPHIAAMCRVNISRSNKELESKDHMAVFMYAPFLLYVSGFW